MTSQEVSDNLAMLVSVLLTEPRITGLHIDIESFLVTYLEKGTFVDSVGQHIEKLLTVLDTSGAAAIETELRYLLGRGKGLTPSGDDHLVGLLAIHAATGVVSETFIETIKLLLQSESLTTDIGKEYLLYAIQGKFSSSVVGLSSALTQKPDIYMLKPLLLELLDMGHSSGIDTIFGMLLGLLARRRKLE
ncbi:DUF2877 domain-containing protein [Sporosarcina aquimarina]|uniref:DUF2877 domain-containing protein n=2 Tax=Sporosarcina aquimarina TaxID=114975 RepID=A0ABU4FYP9_9BACL|nr:DUF2877 domain-containing protein [Sporosarcina aquimarina]